MNAAVCDASVAFKWLHRKGEDETVAAVRLLEAWQGGEVQLIALDLVFYEVGNALARRAGLTADDIVELLDALQTIWPNQQRLTPDLRMMAAHLAEEHGLTYYDAAHLALAWFLRIPLVTADRELLAVGGTSPTDFVASLN